MCQVSITVYLPVHGPSQLHVMFIAVLQSAHSQLQATLTVHTCSATQLHHLIYSPTVQPSSEHGPGERNVGMCACNTSMWGETGLEVKPFLRLCICCLAMERLEHVHMYTHTRDSVTNTHPCCEQASHILT